MNPLPTSREAWLNEIAQALRDASDAIPFGRLAGASFGADELFHLGSHGSRNSRTESRRLRPAAVVDPAVFETTNTSTGWPGSNGRPSKTSSPCSPTVVSLQCACTPSV